MAGAPPYVDYSGEIDGISKADWAAYIGNSAPVYIMRMSQQDKQNTKISFMFSAFFLTPFFFLYRKMWGWAAATIAFGVLGFGLSFLSFMVAASNPAVAFIDPGFLGGLITIYNLLNFVISILAGIFGLYLYRRGAAKKIKALRAIHSDDTAYHAALSKKGGTSIVAVVISIAIIFVFSTIFTYTIGVDIVADFLQESGFYDGF